MSSILDEQHDEATSFVGMATGTNLLGFACPDPCPRMQNPSVKKPATRHGHKILPKPVPDNNKCSTALYHRITSHTLTVCNQHMIDQYTSIMQNTELIVPISPIMNTIVYRLIYFNFYSWSPPETPTASKRENQKRPAHRELLQIDARTGRAAMGPGRASCRDPGDELRGREGGGVRR